MNKDVMNQGVQILLDRMDTNPEEFEDYSGKWGDIIGAVHARKSIPDGHSKDSPLPFLTDPEVNALYDKLEDVRRENFTSDVLRRLADTPKEITQQELWDKPIYSTSNIPHIGTPVTTTRTVTLSEIEKLTEREKDRILDTLDSYNKIEKKNRKLVK
jgi:predicted AlkP superfamily pyrophosphatase or phosphodiesterase